MYNSMHYFNDILRRLLLSFFAFQLRIKNGQWIGQKTGHYIWRLTLSKRLNKFPWF